MKRILFLLALVITFSGCMNKDAFFVNGIIKGENKKKYIYISRLEINIPVLIDSIKINKKGAFRIKVKTGEPDFFQLGFSSSDFITLLAAPGEKISLSFNGNNLFEDYAVSGSEGSEKIQMLDMNLNITQRKLDSLRNVYEKASKEPGFDAAGPQLESQFNDLIKSQRKKNIEFIINNITSLASIKALYQRLDQETYVLYDPKDLQYLKIVTDSLTKHYPNSKQVQALARDFEKEMNQRYINQLGQMVKSLPEKKLDPDLKTIEGKRVSLSSLMGKYVLLTFWSVRSQDCIAENLLLKEYYNMYHKQGLEIYQINLDESESDWRSAVRFDELPWISTREDDPLDPKNAILFNVKSLPTNYLYDKEGKIIGINLHGRSLKVKLEQIFNK